MSHKELEVKMIPYRVYRKRTDDVLSYLATSSALGSGAREIGYIVDSHDLLAGDVIEVEQEFVLLKSIEPGNGWDDPSVVTYEFLAPYEDQEHLFGDGPWSPLMITRLRHEARVCEEMSQ
jgi:hypothetical protein